MCCTCGMAVATIGDPDSIIPPAQMRENDRDSTVIEPIEQWA